MSTMTAVGEGFSQHAADPLTDHLQPPESHGAQWDSGQALQHGGTQDHRDICSGELNSR